MARTSDGHRAGKVEPDRIARMGGRRRNLSVRGQLAMRLKGFRGRTRLAKGFARSNARNPQRVIVKSHVARHKPGKARGSLGRHASYLGRDSASADGQPGVFYDATQQGLDAKEVTATWVPD